VALPWQIIEREFVAEIHSHTQSEVLAAGQAVLEYLGLKRRPGSSEQSRPQFVTNVNPYNAQLINKWRKGNFPSCRDPASSVEATPAAYVTLAGMKAEKAQTSA